MKLFVKGILSVFAATLLALTATLAVPVQSSAAQPESLQSLLNQVQADLNRQTAEDKARVQTFMQARDQQQALVAQVKQQVAQENARSTALQAQFDANDKQLDTLSTTLSTREGNLGVLFGSVRQTAAQFKGILDDSILSAQFPERENFAAKLAASTSLPSIRQLKIFWYDMLETLVEQGQVVKFPANVTLQNGTTVHNDVVRVGAFNTIMGNEYLQYESSANALVVVPRQPPGGYTGLAGNLYKASGDKLMPFGLDPLRGQLLTLLIQVPNFQQRLNEGGAVGYSILVLFALALLVCLERGIYLTITSRKMKHQLKSPDTPKTNNPLGRVLSVYDQNRKDDVETLTLKLDEAILKEVPPLEARQSFIKLIAAVGPLLGLLGTVIGMVVAFTAITLFGTGNPAYMAQGISYALVTTVEGLVTAIPLVFLYSFINAKSRQLIQILEEQSAGILAAQAEKAKQ